MHTEPGQWDLSPKEAILLQKDLAESVRMQPLPSRFGVLGAADIGYSRATDMLVAVMLAFSWPELQLLESVHHIAAVSFPYIPGLLSFREVPPLLETFRKLEHKPDLLLCDGQGMAHPRKFGFATHLGICLQIPTVGCAKSRLCGEHAPLTLRKGFSKPLLLNGEQVGFVYCSRTGVKPIYISPGYLSDFESSRKLVSKCIGRYRIPDPLRLAHNMATRLRRELPARFSD